MPVLASRDPKKEENMPVLASQDPKEESYLPTMVPTHPTLVYMPSRVLFTHS